MRFYYTLKRLHAELGDLYALIEGLPESMVKKTKIHKRMVEIQVAISFLESYEFKEKK